MSLITRCPACTTMFKVVPDQLRVSDGWVRCGQCSEVFDANAHLQPDLDEAGDRPPPSPPSPPPQPVVQPIAADNAAPEAVPPALPEPQPEPFLVVNPRALHIEPEPAPHDAVAVDATRDMRNLRVDADDAAPWPSPETQEGAAKRRPPHSFMRAATAPSPWKRPAVRWTLAAMCLLLTALLVLQVVVQERDRIVATEPTAKPYLERLCAVLDCKISPLRQIESVVIDSSSFTKVRADVYRLSFTLKNTALTNVATPDLELTLTDMQDQAVVRRVLAVVDFGKQQSVLEPGSELQAAVPVAVKLPADSEHIAGYRLLSFYP